MIFGLLAAFGAGVFVEFKWEIAARVWAWVQDRLGDIGIDA